MDEESPDEGTVCTTGQYWLGGYGPTMMPGASCGAATCHGTGFTVVGTVFPSEHEPDLCDGVNTPDAGVDAPDASVWVTGLDGTTISLAINMVGNFVTTSPVLPPFTVKVVSAGSERAMLEATSDGNCNSCHTALGTDGAPGRITLP